LSNVSRCKIRTSAALPKENVRFAGGVLELVSQAPRFFGKLRHVMSLRSICVQPSGTLVTMPKPLPERLAQISEAGRRRTRGARAIGQRGPAHGQVMCGKTADIAAGGIQ